MPIKTSSAFFFQILLTSSLCLAWQTTLHANPSSDPAATGLLKLDVDYSLVSASIELPLHAMVTFSSLPQTPEEHQELETQISQFQDLSFTMIFPDSAGCQIEELNLNTKGKGANSAAVFLAEYKITCPQPRYLERVQVSLFDHFERVTKLKTLVSGSGFKRQGQLNFVNRYLLLR